MAPDTELHLLKIEDEIDFLGATQYCRENQITIINISLSSPTSGPGNGTGPADEIMAELRAAGILVVVAAGNFGLYTEEGFTFGTHWGGAFTDTNNNNIHEFGYYGSDEENWIGALPAADDDGNPLDDEMTIVMNYDGWPGLDVDYDLHLYNADTGVEVARSTTVQSGSLPPQEVIILDIPN